MVAIFFFNHGKISGDFLVLPKQSIADPVLKIRPQKGGRTPFLGALKGLDNDFLRKVNPRIHREVKVQHPPQREK